MLGLLLLRVQQGDNLLRFKRPFNLFLGQLHVYILTNSLGNIISKLRLQKSSILQHMSSLIQPILDKAIVDHSIVHTILMEYFSIADKVIYLYPLNLFQIIYIFHTY